MCTAVSYSTRDHYFGRNLDLEVSFHEAVTITPRRFPFEFREAGSLPVHHAIIGMATIADGYPLYYDATNEKGLSMAGLNFPQNADYKPKADDKTNVAPFEFIPWLLGQAATVEESLTLLASVSLVKIDFSTDFRLSPLHWIIADATSSIVVESVAEGLRIYENPVGVLTNNPTFDRQLFGLNNYMHLSRKPPQKNFAQKLDFDEYSRGMGALGLPGDLSSASRFVKAAFTKMNSVAGESEGESVSQFFHILGSVAQQRGCVEVAPDSYEITIYSSCCNTVNGVYYYTTYDNSQVVGVDMHKEDLDSTSLVSYPLIRDEQIQMAN